MAYRGRRAAPATGPKRVVLLVAAALVYGAALAGFPFMIVSGVSGLGHASQIRAHGVAVTATVLSDDENYSGHGGPCWGAQVSYATTGGTIEQADLGDEGGCLPVSSDVRIVYDALAPTVIQLASERGNTRSSWGVIIAGSLLTALVWGVLVRMVVSWRRKRARGATGHQQVTAATAAAPPE